MSRTPSVRARVLVGLLISIGVHAAAFAVVKIQIPVAGTSELGLVTLAEIDAPDPTPRPVIQVIEIRPPGMRLPSGGGGSEGLAHAEQPASHAPDPASVATPAPRRTASRGVSTVSLAPSSPVTRNLEIVLATTEADDEAETPARRPGRGVVLRGTNPSSPAGSGGGGSAGRGLGVGTGGVTIVGPGGDCITPGLSIPSRKVPDERPQLGAAGRPTARTGGIGSRFRPR